MLFQLLYHKFLSQTTDPSLSKAMKVARLQLACKPGSSSSQRVLPRLSVAECFELMQLRPFFHLPFPISVISHFFIPRSWFYQFPFSLVWWPGATTGRRACRWQKLMYTASLLHTAFIMPRWAEPRRHTMIRYGSRVCVWVSVSFREIVVSHISAIDEN